MSTTPDSMQRIFPRPTTAEIEDVSTTESDRVKVPCRTQVGRVVGGTLERLATGGGSETEVDLWLWRAATPTDCDFMDKVTLTLETADDETGQASFAFNPPLEFSSSEYGFWVSLANSAEADEHYRIEFDVIPGSAWGTR